MIKSYEISQFPLVFTILNNPQSIKLYIYYSSTVQCNSLILFKITATTNIKIFSQVQDIACSTVFASLRHCQQKNNELYIQYLILYSKSIPSS